MSLLQAGFSPPMPAHSGPKLLGFSGACLVKTALHARLPQLPPTAPNNPGSELTAWAHGVGSFCQKKSNKVPWPSSPGSFFPDLSLWQDIMRFSYGTSMNPVTHRLQLYLESSQTQYCTNIFHQTARQISSLSLHLATDSICHSLLLIFHHNWWKAAWTIRLAWHRGRSNATQTLLVRHRPAPAAGFQFPCSFCATRTSPESPNTSCPRPASHLLGHCCISATCLQRKQLWAIKSVEFCGVSVFLVPWKPLALKRMCSHLSSAPPAPSVWLLQEFKRN